ncbi:MAG: hypothetical protein AAF281_08635 [Pseudomonadota bacterium]
MDWTEQINAYCERLDPGYWAEPVNALTNVAFLLAALFCWQHPAVRRDAGAVLLTANLALIGLGSYLFHTHATRWALLTDVVPIQTFILIYLYFATKRFFALPWWAGGGAVVMFFPYAYLAAAGVGALTGPLNGSLGYVPVAILIAVYGLLLLHSAPATGRGLIIGAAILALSLTFRTVDAAVCAALPLGTHFLWHILNGVMLGWMILVLVRHPLPGQVWEQ